MARLSDLAYDQLAALLAPAASFVRPRVVGMPTPPATKLAADWCGYFASLSESLLADLLEKLLPNDELVPVIATLRTATLATLAPLGRPELPDETPHIVLKRLPVVDRLDVWQHLRSLYNGDAHILQVRGNSKAGKSYVGYLVHEVCNLVGNGHEVVQKDLVGMQSLPAIVAYILEGISDEPRVKDRDAADSNEQAWARQVADAVYARVVADTTRTRWFVFDHFARAKRNDAMLFFAAFAERVAIAATSPHIKNAPRLVLIDQGHPLGQFATVSCVETEVRNVNAVDVERFVRLCQHPDPATRARLLYDGARAEADTVLAQLKAVPQADNSVGQVDPFMLRLQASLLRFLRNPAGAGT